MGPIDYILIAGIALIVGAIVFFIVRSKKKGKKCIGCPDSASCSHGSTGTCSGSCGSCGGNCACGHDHK